MSQIKVELQESMGSDRSIAEAAWTSSLDHQKKKIKSDEQVKNLIIRLANEKHSTPFESVIFKFWIKMPIQTDRQHMTHRIGSHNGMSGRYRTMPNEWLSIPEDIKSILNRHSGWNIEQDYNKLCKTMNNWYLNVLQLFKDHEWNCDCFANNEYKRLREFFRGVLPQNNMTERVTIFNLRSFANYQKLRNSEYAQPEIKKVAQLMLEEVKKSNICSIAIEALERNGWNI